MFDHFCYYPIVFTRPFRKYLDYRYFACPEPFENNFDCFEKVRKIITNISFKELHENNRWHIFKVGEFAVCGIATRRFGRLDEYGRRPSCGFYGVVVQDEGNYITSLKDGKVKSVLPTGIVIPNMQFVDWLDAHYVEPVFKDENVVCKYEGKLDIENFQGRMFYQKKSEFNSVAVKRIDRELNTNCDVVRLFPQKYFEENERLFLFVALVRAVRSKSQYEIMTQVDISDDAVLHIGCMNVFSAKECGIREIRRGVRNAQTNKDANSNASRRLNGECHNPLRLVEQGWECLKSLVSDGGRHE